MRITIDAESVGDSDRAAREREKRRRRAAEKLSGGLFWCLAWGAAYYFLHWRWAIFPLVFAGIFPLASGAKAVLSERLAAPARRRIGADERRAEVERGILRLARERSGVVTPSLVAIETGLGLEEAQSALDALAARGHASLRILESGRIEYEFPEFAP